MVCFISSTDSEAFIFVFVEASDFTFICSSEASDLPDERFDQLLPLQEPASGGVRGNRRGGGEFIQV